MKKSRLLMVGGTLFIMQLICQGFSAEVLAQGKQVIKLSCANYFPPAHELTILQGEFLKEIEKRTNGRVAINYFPGGSLLGPTKMHDGVIQGIADIGCAHIGYSRGRFPQTEVFSLPLGFPDAWVAAKCVKDFVKEYRPELKEWDSVHILYLHTATAGAIMTSKKQIRVMEDLKGVTLRSIGLTAEAVEALGATPRDLPVGEIYDAIAKGVIDGATISLEAAKGFKLAEVAKYCTYSWQLSAVSVFYVIMNKNKWNSLPADIQKIFNDVSVKYEDKFATAWNEVNIEGKKFFKSKAGNTYYELLPEEGVKWHKATLPVTEKWIKDMRAAGFSEERQKEHVNFLVKRIGYWIEKEKELKIPTPIKD